VSTPAAVTWIYHITHVDNLPGIAAHGLVCDKLVPVVATSARSIAYENIKVRRAGTPVRKGPLGTLADYVPFYFAPRSPMLFTISRNNVPGAHNTQPDIVHLVVDARAVVAAGHRYVFTSGHAVIELSDFYDDLANLDQLDWDAINTSKWGSYYDSTDETKRKKQSEFLVHQRVAWDMVKAIGVKGPACEAKVRTALSGVSYQPQVVVRPNWYY
jgi:hypothetical protein